MTSESLCMRLAIDPERIAAKSTHPFRCVRVPQIPHQYNWICIIGNRSDEFRLLFRMPCNRTDSFSIEVVEGERLFFSLHIPHSQEPSTSTSNQDVRNFLIPVQAIKVICSSHLVTQHKRVIGVVEIPYVELKQTVSLRRRYVPSCISYLTSPLAPAVASSSDLNGLNCSDLIAPLCFAVCEIRGVLDFSIKASALHRSSEPFSNAPAIMPLGLSFDSRPQAIS